MTHPCFFITYLFLLSLSTACAQTDTINQLDSRDRRHGYWVITNGMNNPKDYSARRDSTFAQGRYEHGKRQGVWTQYNNHNGNINFRATYDHDTLNGIYWLYNYEGILSESYCIQGMRMSGEHYLYIPDSTGILIAHRCGAVKGFVDIPNIGKIDDTIHVNVQLIEPQNRLYYGYGFVDSTGHYCISDLLPGVYTISGWSYDVQMEADTIEIRLDDTLTHDLKVRRYHVGKPAPVICVQLNSSLRSTAEIRIGLLDWHSNIGAAGWRSNEFTAGSEINFRFRDLIFGPKINYTRTQGRLFFGIPYGASLIYYTDKSNGYLYLQPHAGVTLISVADISVGYNISLQNKTYFKDRIPSLVVSATIRLWNSEKYVE